MSQVVRQRPSIMSVVRELVASAMPKHMWMHRERKLCCNACSLDHPQEPRCRYRSSGFCDEYVRAHALQGRNARSSGPCNGCTLSYPPLALFTCSRPCLRSICDQRSWQSSCALSPCRYASKIAALSRSPFRPRLLAASISRSTSASVRYSLGRYSALGLRSSVRFIVVGAVSVIGNCPYVFEVGVCGVFVIQHLSEHYTLSVSMIDAGSVYQITCRLANYLLLIASPPISKHASVRKVRTPKIRLYRAGRRPFANFLQISNVWLYI
jgi:hypothetical protein